MRPITAQGTIKEWREDDGWGVLVSPEVSGDVWAHGTQLRPFGYAPLQSGQAVEFSYIEMPGGGQDGYSFRAEWFRLL